MDRAVVTIVAGDRGGLDERCGAAIEVRRLERGCSGRNLGRYDVVKVVVLPGDFVTGLDSAQVLGDEQILTEWNLHDEVRRGR